MLWAKSTPEALPGCGLSVVQRCFCLEVPWRFIRQGLLPIEVPLMSGPAQLTGVCGSSRRLNSPTAGDLPHRHGALPISAAQTSAAGLTWSYPRTGAAAPDGSIDHCGGDANSGERTRGCFPILAREGLGRAENMSGQFLITPKRHAS